MRLSTKSTYGLRAMLNLAARREGPATSIADISKSEGISASYLEQLFNKLRREGLVKSVRGPGGGYLLARRPRDITVGDVVRTLEGDTSPIYCVTNSKLLKRRACSRSGRCSARIVWERLARAIDGVLDSTNLEDLENMERGAQKGVDRI